MLRFQFCVFFLVHALIRTDNKRRETHSAVFMIYSRRTDIFSRHNSFNTLVSDLNLLLANYKTRIYIAENTVSAGDILDASRFKEIN